MEYTTLDTKDQIDDLLSKLPDDWMALSLCEQELSVQLYRILSRGVPVSRQDLYHEVDLSPEVIDGLLDQWPGVYYDDDQRIIGYWGLALPKMSHEFRVGSRKLYTWCAWDALFIPELIGETATVLSKCAWTGDTIRMTVAPDKIVDVSPDTVYVSLLQAPDEDEMRRDVIQSFCHFVYFFSSVEVGQAWTAEHPGTFLVPLEDAFQFGRRKNVIQYGDLLH